MTCYDYVTRQECLGLFWTATRDGGVEIRHREEGDATSLSHGDNCPHFQAVSPSHFRAADQSQREVSVIDGFGKLRKSKFWHPNNFHTVPKFYSDALIQTKYIILVLYNNITVKSLRLLSQFVRKTNKNASRRHQLWKVRSRRLVT